MKHTTYVTDTFNNYMQHKGLCLFSVFTPFVNVGSSPSPQLQSLSLVLCGMTCKFYHTKNVLPSPTVPVTDEILVMLS